MNDIEEVRRIAEGEVRIILYGAGSVGKAIFKYLLDIGVAKDRMKFMVSEDLNHQRVMGVPVHVASKCNDIDGHIIIATMPDKHREIEDYLAELFGHTSTWKPSMEFIMSLPQMHLDAKKIAADDEEHVDVLYMSSDNDRVSGAFISMVDLTKELNRSDVTTLVVLPYNGDGEELLIEHDIKYTIVCSEHWFTDRKEYKLADNNGAISEVKRIIGQKDVRLVHNNTVYTYIGAVAASRCGIPYVWHLRENIYMEHWEFRDRQYSMMLINDASRIIATSEYIANSYPELDREKMEIIHDGVDSNRYKLKTEHLECRNSIGIICIGGIRPLKGQIDLVKAAAELKNVTPEFVIRFLGRIEDEGYYRHLQKIIADEGLSEQCTFFGSQSDITRFYEMSDISVICSRSEAFGRATVESLIAGLVVIGARAGATTELLGEADAGQLYNPGDAVELAKCLTETISDLESYKMKADNQKDYFAERFSNEAYAKQMERVYRSIIIE